jgi:hypothetical protein
VAFSDLAHQNSFFFFFFFIIIIIIIFNYFCEFNRNAIIGMSCGNRSKIVFKESLGNC